jgi:hypothetical protein
LESIFMPATFTEAFDDGLTHTTFDYVSDNGTTYAGSIRAAYIALGVTSGTSPAASSNKKPKNLTMRHIFWQAVTAVNGRYARRKVPCNIADIQLNFAPGAAPAATTMDAVAFKPKGFRGESRRG